jgi:phosphatidylglycerophosphatase A
VNNAVHAYVKIHFYCRAGWCYIRVVQNSNGDVDHSTTVLAEVVGYELWFYATFVSLAAIYITMLFYLKYKVRHRSLGRASTSNNYRVAMQI